MTVLTRLQCQNCSAQLDRSDAFEKTLKCKYCGSTYQLETPADADFSEEFTQLVPKTGLKAVKPDDLKIDKSSNSFQATRIWRKNGSFILLAMAIIWLLVILNQIAETWLEGMNASILFLLVFVAVGGLLLYRALSEIFNQSTLTVNKQSVNLKTKPFAWKGDFSYPLNKIKYFEIVPPPGPSISPSTKAFRLCAITADDMRLTLLHKIKNPGHAIYLLREINELTKKQ